MNRLILLVFGIVLLMGPQPLRAQHRGGGHGAGTTGGRGGASGTDDLKDFKRALALQASPDQVIQFRQLTESTQAVRQRAQDLVKLENASKSDLLLASNHLTSALDTAHVDNQRFLQTFSDVQKSGLKEDNKKLSKANSEVTKESKDLTRDVERSRITGKQISGIAEKLDRAIGDLQARQLAIGSEMGIQSEASSQ